MPNLVPTSADEFVQQQLDGRLLAIEEAFDADALCISGTLLYGVDDLVRTIVEELRARAEPRDRLVVLLTTDGGYLQPVHRIVDTIRHHYAHVGFIIPNQAFSAGTVLAMSGDNIYMDYYSRLGPIDPQVQSARGRPVPALGYLIAWDRLLGKAKDGKLTEPEVLLMLQGFDQAELYAYEEARELSVALLKEWLVNYKFKNWEKTQTRKRPVTARMRQTRAEAIARELNNTKRWHSHGYGISMAVLQNDLKLLIDDLDEPGNIGRREPVKGYDILLSDYMMKRQDTGVLHAAGRYRPYM